MTMSRVPLPPPPLLLLVGMLVASVTLATSQQHHTSSNHPTSIPPPPPVLLPCEGRDSCLVPAPSSGETSPRAPRMLITDMDWKDRNCMCDQMCAHHADCCDDAPAFMDTEKYMRPFECRDLRQFGGVYMLSQCASTWRGDPDTKRRCEEDDLTDPVSSSLPVTNKDTGTTFRNLHCALCNHEVMTSGHWDMWGARLECPSLLTGSRDLASIRQALRFEDGSWGLRLPRLAGDLMPQAAHSRTEETHSKLTDVADKVEAFLQSSIKNESRSRLLRGRHLDDTSERTSPITTTSTTVTPLSTSSGLRHLSRRQYALYNASQFHRNDSALTSLLRQRRLELSPSTSGGEALGDQHPRRWSRGGGGESRARRDVMPEDNEIFHKCFVDPVLPDTSQHLIRRCKVGVIGDCPSAWVDMKVRTLCRSHTAYVYRSSNTYRNVYCAMCWGVPVQELSCVPVTLRTTLNKDFFPVAFAVIFDFGTSGGTVGSTSCPDKHQIYDPFVGTCRQLVCAEGTIEVAGKWNCVSRTHNNKMRPALTHADHSTNDTTPISTPPCTQHMLSKDDFLLDPDDNKLEISATGIVIDSEKYTLLENGSALVCNPSYYNYTLTGDTGEKFGPMLGYITLVGLGISIVCLTLHLLAFILVPSRATHGHGNNSGNSNSAKNLASLCTALLVAYCGFLVGQLARFEHHVCVTSAIVTFYSFLAAFTWMLAVSLDIWRSLRLATTQLRTSSGGRKQWKRFLANSIFCWMIPAIIVLSAYIIEYAPQDSVPDELRPGFGARPGLCWFSSRRALLVFFAAPISIVMVLNAVFFTSSAIMIYSTTASTAGGPRRDFRLYLRLAVLMGLTWSVGLLAGFLDTPLLWVVFVVLNTLQGLFIFLAFTCTEKMIRSFKDCRCFCWRRKNKRDRAPSSTLSAGPPHGIKKLSQTTSSDLPWSAFSNSVVSSKSSHSEHSSSRDTDETLY